MSLLANFFKTIIPEFDADADARDWGSDREDSMGSETISDSEMSSNESTSPSEASTNSEKDASDDGENENDSAKAKEKLLEFKSCSCTKKHDKGCLSLLPNEEILPVIAQYHFKKNWIGQTQKRLVLHTAIMVNCKVGNRKRKCVEYKLFGETICREGFVFAFNTSKNLIDSILRDLPPKDGILYPSSSLRKSARPAKKGKYIIEFLNTIASLRGVPCPSAVRKTRRKPTQGIVFLPRGTIKKNLYEEFRKLKDNFSSIGTITKRWFNAIWRDKCSHIRILKKGSDYCDTCSKYILDAKHDPDAKKKLKIHKDKAYAERLNYVRQCENPFWPHYTFDFAQSVNVPLLLRQPGTYFFKKRLPLRIFGVSCETQKTQMNYVLPEGHYPAEKRGKGKGSNLVISLLHHFLETYNPSKHIRLHADNCGGQNKNQFVFYYFIWLVIIGKLDSVSLSFMVPGHTKSVVDALFGI